MTEIPEHLRKRAEEARGRAAGVTASRSSEVPRHLLERAERARVLIPGTEPVHTLPGEPYDPPLKAEERERIAIVLTNLRSNTDQAVDKLLSAAERASEAADLARGDLERRHRTAMILAVVGTFLVTVLCAAVIVLLAIRAS